MYTQQDLTFFLLTATESFSILFINDSTLCPAGEVRTSTRNSETFGIVSEDRCASPPWSGTPEGPTADPTLLALDVSPMTHGRVESRNIRKRHRQVPFSLSLLQLKTVVQRFQLMLNSQVLS